MEVENLDTKRPIRILSDLHLAHPASLIKEAGQLCALLDGAGTVIFNGDTVERLGAGVRTSADRCLAELTDLCRERGIEPLFINGNHDPDISAFDHIELFDGRLLVTHGHGLFPDIAPWGRDATRLRTNFHRALRRIGNDGNPKLEHQLAAATEACRQTCCGEVSESGLRWLGNVLSELAHPLRPLEMIRAWINTPGLAASFAARYRPHAECIILGHTHYPGSWRRDGRCIMNTGAYLPGLGRRMVDVVGEQVFLRKVERASSGFRPGAEVASWSLTPSRNRVAPGFAERESVADF